MDHPKDQPLCLVLDFQGTAFISRYHEPTDLSFAIWDDESTLFPAEICGTVSEGITCSCCLWVCLCLFM